MIFTEFRFLFFFALVFSVYWALRSDRWRKIWLLAASYVFYGAWDWRFLSLIIASTLVDYVAALRIAAARTPRARRGWLITSLVTNLGILGVFKYFGFFLDSLRDLTSLLGFEMHVASFAIVLPVGISFFTFQTMSYSIDVYRGVLEARRSLLDIALFVGFFPQLVAGPIVRASEFLPQLAAPRVFRRIDVRGFLVLFLVGFVKKACISDNIAPAVEAYFADPATFTAVSAWIGVLLYAVQIYCDFSAYSDMAIACAGLLGYDLVLNFDFPYLSPNITDFWRRWHMSLSRWLRDYLYIPLGGSHGGRWFTYRNLMLTMLLGGLWHGAAWNFVIWGGLHGLALIAHKEWTRRFGGVRWLARPVSVLGPAITFYWVCVAWIFFRAVGVESATTVLRSFVLLRSPGAETLRWEWLAAVALLAVIHVLAWSGAGAKLWRSVPGPVFAASYGAAAATALVFVVPNTAPFIYFQF